VFVDFHRYLKTAVVGEDKSDIGTVGIGKADPPDLLYRPEGIRIASRIRDLAANDFASFSSLYGPVPKPRNYRPPAADDLTTMIERRFSRLFALILEKENF